LIIAKGQGNFETLSNNPRSALILLKKVFRKQILIQSVF
jgi:uncharacterized protein with ATP-grasp and redox domains